MKNQKKKIAAISAVILYIRSQEEAAVSVQAETAKSAETATATVPGSSQVSLWGASGRQQQMNIRSMMQLKAFHFRK